MAGTLRYWEDQHLWWGRLCLHASLPVMGVNATGTLRVAGRAPKTRENRGAVGGEGGPGRAVALPRKFMNFRLKNGVIWCIMGVLFLRFMCPMDCSCMTNFIEVPVCA